VTRRTVNTKEAAFLLRLDAKSFAREMRKRGVEPERTQRIGRSTVTVWDLQKLRAATAIQLDDN
jgi:hypothetical protein